MKNKTAIKDEFIFTGALDDNRSQEDQAKDYQAEEIASLGPVDWQELDTNKLAAMYPVRNQDGSGSCVAQTGALMLGIENAREEGRFVELSAADIYTRRRNSGAGMIGNDAMEIMKNYGASLEIFMPSQNMGETAINAVPRTVSDEQIGKVFKSGGYVHFSNDIEKIASFMKQHEVNGIKKPVMIWFKFPLNEWSSEPGKIKVGTDTRIVHHSLTCFEFGLYKGRKVLVIQDSWGLHSTTIKGLRFIDQDFVTKYMTFCAGLVDLRNDWREVEEVKPEPKPEPEPTPNKPRYSFKRALSYGLKNDNDVVALQNILKYEGFFPTTVQSTGNYYQITAKAVLAWQFAHNVASANELNSLQGRVVGPKTRAMLNSLYN